MFATLADVTERLDRRGVCLPAFDIAGGQPDFVLGALRACEDLRCPALLLIWAPGATYMGLEAGVDLVKHFADRSSVPVILHLDHGHSEELVEQALGLGFRSVMFDGSALPLAENIRRTKAMVELARGHGASIEGELGRFGQELHSATGDMDLTDPAEAEQFVRQTGIDYLAPAVGNAHGFYKQPPRLRFELIEQLRQRTGVPLSLHGGTGIPLADVRRAGQLGVRKMNIASQFHKNFSDALFASPAGDAQKQYTWMQALHAGRKAIYDLAAQYIRELGAENLA